MLQQILTLFEEDLMARPALRLPLVHLDLLPRALRLRSVQAEIRLPRSVQAEIRLPRSVQAEIPLPLLVPAKTPLPLLAPAETPPLPITPAGRLRQRLGPRTRHHDLPHQHSTRRSTHRTRQAKTRLLHLARTVLLTPSCMNA